MAVAPKRLIIQKLIGLADLATLIRRNRYRPFMSFSSHGYAQRGNHHPLYDVWQSIRARCYNPNNNAFPRYGGRGIGMADEWRDNVCAFISWAEANGYEPGLEIDRSNNDLGYTPENCRWVTREINTNNRCTNVFITAFDETKTIAQWVKDPRSVVSENTLRRRLGLGWDPEKALIDNVKMVALQDYICWGEKKTLKEWSQEPRCKVCYSTLKGRLQRGISLYDAMTTPSLRER